MQIKGEDGWIELERRDDDEAFEVSCMVSGFGGSNPNIWIATDEQLRFLDELRQLETARRGTARIAAMSPDELEIVVRVVDPVGHVAVAGMVGRVYYRRQQIPEADRLVVRFGFDLDPTSLRSLVRDWQAIVEAG